MNKQLLNRNSCRSQVNCRVWIVIISLVMVMLFMVGTAYAAATFGKWTGPHWLCSGYQFTVDVTAMSNPHNQVCITYSVDAGSDHANACVCSLPDCNPSTSAGNWVCTIPNEYVDATIAWDMSAHPGHSCRGIIVQGPTGSFSTSPNAITLMSFTAEGKSGLDFTIEEVMIIVLGVTIILVVLLWKKKLCATGSSQKLGR